MAPCNINEAAFWSNFSIFLDVFMSKLLDKLKAPSLDSLSSHIAIGIEILFDRYLAKSFADCAEEPFEPSMLIGFPTMIPFILFSIIISLISLMKLELFFLTIVLKGVETSLSSSDIAKPRRFLPGSIPNNLDFLIILVFL